MRVVIFGGGYAGLTVARRLERSLPEDVELVVVDESGSHLVQHELHRVVRYPSLASTITLPLEDVLTRATPRTGRVVDLDYEAGTATLETDDEVETLSYDFAAVCLGSEPAFYGLPGVEEHATPLKRIEDARGIHDEVREHPGGTVLVAGAGLSGIQTAGELAELSNEANLGLDVKLVEREPQIAPGFDPPFARALYRELDARGIGVETDVEITAATEDAVEFEDRGPGEYDVLVWTGGIRGPTALGGNRMPVDADLRISNSTFVVGDAGMVTDVDGRDVPASAQTAVREGAVVARNIRRLVHEKHHAVDGVSSSKTGTDNQLSTYRYESAGWTVSVGDGAVAKVGPLIVSGKPARELKALISGSHLGSVGAIGRATDLVASELGWPTSRSVDDRSRPSTVWETTVPSPADPASFSDLQTWFTGPVEKLLGSYGPTGTVDLTWLTKPSRGTSAGKGRTSGETPDDDIR